MKVTIKYNNDTIKLSIIRNVIHFSMQSGETYVHTNNEIIAIPMKSIKELVIDDELAQFDSFEVREQLSGKTIEEIRNKKNVL